MLNRSLIIFASKLIGYCIRLILPVILVRIMTVADFGAYRQFFLIEMYVVTLFQFGINQALYYFVPRDERNAGAKEAEPTVYVLWPGGKKVDAFVSGKMSFMTYDFASRTVTFREADIK